MFSVIEYVTIVFYETDFLWIDWTLFYVIIKTYVTMI